MIAQVFILFTFVLFSNQQTANDIIEGYLKVVEPLKPDCIKESGANPDFIDKALKDGKFPDDKASQCFWKCFFKKLNLINDKEEVIEENIRQFIGVPDKKVADEIFEKCIHLRGSDICESINNIGMCVYTSAIAAAGKQ
ncbi:hypothetical protein ILUMI_02302 [Ignelater luminosus]|uniref:Uncharacterized protein n=1 Tax=Ignelater luminosus TaxID=2038154 RepID=A0A8K0GKY7_IGNLU|nr:hypothetical protein ILUMI_02302 [Ignelater luminosus]